jgi:hypothetical protein
MVVMVMVMVGVRVYASSGLVLLGSRSVFGGFYSSMVVSMM